MSTLKKRAGGWHGAWELIRKYGSPEAVPEAEKDSYLDTVLFPEAVWAEACLAARGRWPGSRRHRIEGFA